MTRFEFLKGLSGTGEAAETERRAAGVENVRRNGEVVDAHRQTGEEGEETATLFGGDPRRLVRSCHPRRFPGLPGSTASHPGPVENELQCLQNEPTATRTRRRGRYHPRHLATGHTRIGIQGEWSARRHCAQAVGESAASSSADG